MKKPKRPLVPPTDWQPSSKWTVWTSWGEGLRYDLDEKRYLFASDHHGDGNLQCITIVAPELREAVGTDELPWGLAQLPTIREVQYVGEQYAQRILDAFAVAIARPGTFSKLLAEIVNNNWTVGDGSEEPDLAY
jgi:hypothetical protein